jgi:hypothetical protein
LLEVADAGDAVFAPAIRPTASVVVREVIPGVSVGTVVLADRAPLAFTEVWAPLFPGLLSEAVFFQAKRFFARQAHPTAIYLHYPDQQVFIPQPDDDLLILSVR